MTALSMRIITEEKMTRRCFSKYINIIEELELRFKEIAAAEVHAIHRCYGAEE